MNKKIIIGLVVVLVLAVVAGVSFLGITKKNTGGDNTSKSISAGISGTVRYTGAKNGGLIAVAATKLNEPPISSTAKMFKNATSGDFTWNLAPGTYFANAFRTVDRIPEGGGPRAGEPIVNCGPITVKAGELTKIELVITDASAGEVQADCSVK